MLPPISLDIILHLDAYLTSFIQDYGLLVYLILFLIIFLETGLVIFPFLPGDSLLFVAGALAAAGSLNVYYLFIILGVAAILGDTINYWIGFRLGPKVFTGKIRFLKKEYLDMSEKFYEKHGSRTIILARFIPIIRTFAPFVAGIGKMKYRKFLSFNVIGGIAWVLIFLVAGFLFGNLPFVKDNLGLVIIAIIVISIIIALAEIQKAKKRH